MVRPRACGKVCGPNRRMPSDRPEAAPYENQAKEKRMYRGWHRNISVMQHILKRAGEMTPSMKLQGDTAAVVAAMMAKIEGSD